MLTIKPLPVPKEAYNPDRPLSDLIKAQLKHFQHLEHTKLPHDAKSPFQHHRLTTEREAAKYIAYMTHRLCEETPAEASPSQPSKRTKQAPKKRTKTTSRSSRKTKGKKS